jgi:hypothetical protein
MEMAAVFARYAVEARSEWAREIARRSQLLATYDALDTGQSMDLIDGGSKVNDCPREAIVQALEVGPGIASGGATPKAMNASGAVETTR